MVAATGVAVRSRFVGIAGALAWGVGRVVRDRFERPVPEPASVMGDAPPFPADRPLVVACWNIQYCGGRSAAFFYDGGPRVHVDEAERDATLAAVVAELRAIDADVVLLQEVDVRSDRTGRLDQRRAIADALAVPTYAYAPYFDVPYVPAPFREPLGRVRCDLLVLSKWKLAWATRHPLPMLAEHPLRRAYNLRRAVLEVNLACAGGRRLSLMNVHLSAFSFGDGTLARQMDVIDRLCAEREREGVPWLLAGDFNSLPPWDPPARLDPAHAPEYRDATPPLERMFERWNSPLPRDAELARFGTYVPIGSNGPDRIIDHVFHGAGLRVADHQVHQGLGHVSDHLPLVERILLDFQQGPSLQ